MDRYQHMFEQLQNHNEAAYIPFVSAGDPDLATSEAIINCLVESGADALELGIPFSDPIADGPTIQKASIRALSNQVTPKDCMTLIKRIRERHATLPIGLLLYSNLITHSGLDHFYAAAEEAGVDSILVADVPVRESAPFYAAAQKHHIKHIFIAPPNAADATLAHLAQHSQGYTYLLGRAGVTGTETAAEIPASDLVSKLEHLQVAPPIIGFGISKPAQVKAAIEAGAAGAIAGSATVKLIEENLGDKPAMLNALSAFTQAMKAATRHA